MSVTTKKRFVMKQVKSELFLPKENERVARVLRCPGRNLHEVIKKLVEDEKGEQYLASMPRKFRETIYIKRGNFVFVTPIEEGVKVKAEITQILDNENILYIRERRLWPERFEIYAESITREAKRGVSAGSTKKHDVIDEDMLPPSDSDEDVSEEEERAEKIEELNDDSFDLAEDGEEEVDDEGASGDENGEESDSDEVSAFRIYNPNRLRRL